MIGDDTVE